VKEARDVTILFEPFTLRGLTLKNRIVVSPMCQYSAGDDARATEWHLVHLGSRAVGGAALVMVEATSVESRGRLSLGDLGLYDDAQIAPLARIADFVHAQGAAFAIQLAHGGRKAWSGASFRPEGVTRGFGPEPIVSAGSAPFDEGWAVPHALDASEIAGIVRSFRASASRALTAGFDVIELHGAHGYLLHGFLSPLENRRTDAYGGSLENRARIFVEVARAVREVWPAHKPLFARLSCTDWLEGGFTPDDAVAVSRLLAAAGVDAIDCSSGGAASKASIPVGPGYQVFLADKIKSESGIPTIAVGMLTSARQCAEIVARGQADLVALAREELRDPYFPLRAARELGVDVPWPPAYARAKQ
jgi:2,4-dienoyl-CoA reductase-like NADH-dependent reductase (Old Yellow Enzyme family)